MDEAAVEEKKPRARPLLAAVGFRVVEEVDASLELRCHHLLHRRLVHLRPHSHSRPQRGFSASGGAASTEERRRGGERQREGQRGAERLSGAERGSPAAGEPYVPVRGVAERHAAVAEGADLEPAPAKQSVLHLDAR